MQRETIGVTVLTLAVAAVLGAGAWLWLSTGGDSSSDPTSEPAPPADPSAGPTLDVPRCPVRIQPGGDFERAHLDRDTPHLRVRSARRGITVDVSCKSADEQFDRDQFLSETLQAVRQKFADDLMGERQFELGEASGWSLRAERDGTMRFVNVLIHDRDIVLINVAGPIDPTTRDYNETLVEERLAWPGVH